MFPTGFEAAIPARERRQTDALDRGHCDRLICLITLVNTQNVSVTKIVYSSSIQCAESKNGLRIQFLALDVKIHEVWLNA
jgi:hypothetical protein